MELKWYKLKTSNVILIGESPYFNEDDEVEICNMGFGTYKGIEVKKRYHSNVWNGDVYKTKAEAVAIAKKNYQDNLPFSDGTIPFEIVLYLSGIGWQIFSSNTVNNEHFIRKQMAIK